jgi:voltage-gated potassium channel
MKSNFSYLLVALLIFLIGVPVADDLHVVSQPLARSLAFATLLIIGVWSLKGAGWLFAAGMTFAVLAIVLNIVAVNTDASIFLASSFVMMFAFLLIAIINALSQVAFGHEISFNRLIGAVCIYLLLGLIWAVAYTLIEIAQPGSFSGLSDTGGASGWDPSWLYFSFVTMTTLGYGDLLPLTATARMLAYAQAVFGQFYVAVLVAGLVGAYIADHRNKDQKN